jgi:hypothetical protein
VHNNKTWVSHYKDGLPRIIGNAGRLELESVKQALNSGLQASPFSRALISLISIFRAMSPKDHIPKFGTITDPFNGVSETLPQELVKEAIDSLVKSCGSRLPWKLRSPTFFLSTKSGVNANVAYLSVGLDLLAIMRNPSIWFNMLLYAMLHRYRFFIFIFIFMSILCLPLLPFSFFFDLYLGRLSLIKELRGKTRVIGITDHWTQWLFKPLHDAVYSFLDKLPNDGTSNQLGPLKLMLGSNVNSEFYSIDLSAATDRLPVKLQEQILDEIGYGGRFWRNILNRPYFYGGKPYIYSVGQPMGAYSSFAMLALTNHVVMHCAALHSNITIGDQSLKPVYCILGDDVAIADSKLAQSYVYLMSNVLGVVINPIKGFEGKVIEFAKNWFHSTTGVNLTPLGAKASLHAIRQPTFFTALLADYFKKEYNLILKLELAVLYKYMQENVLKRIILCL